MTTRKQPRRARTHIVEHQDGYHITYNRDDGFGALIDTPYFSANCLGYFPTQDSAWHAISEYRLAEQIDAEVTRREMREP